MDTNMLVLVRFRDLEKPIGGLDQCVEGRKVMFLGAL